MTGLTSKRLTWAMSGANAARGARRAETAVLHTTHGSNGVVPLMDRSFGDERNMAKLTRLGDLERAVMDHLWVVARASNRAPGTRGAVGTARPGVHHDHDRASAAGEEEPRGSAPRRSCAPVRADARARRACRRADGRRARPGRGFGWPAKPHSCTSSSGSAPTRRPHCAALLPNWSQRCADCAREEQDRLRNDEQNKG